MGTESYKHQLLILIEWTFNILPNVITCFTPKRHGNSRSQRGVVHLKVAKLARCCKAKDHFPSARGAGLSRALWVCQIPRDIPRLRDPQNAT